MIKKINRFVDWLDEHWNVIAIVVFVFLCLLTGGVYIIGMITSVQGGY